MTRPGAQSGALTAQNLGVHKLYRYQAFSAAERTDVDRLRRAVLERQIYMSRPDSFNDPWDCRPWYNPNVASDAAILERNLSKYVEVTRRQFPRLSLEEVQKRANWFRQNPDEFTKRIPEISIGMRGAINDRYRVYCMASRPDSELMWAHYARSHTDICLELESGTLPLSGAFQARYHTTYPSYEWAAEDPDEGLDILLTKSAAWSYEEEFRFIVQTQPYVSDSRIYCSDSTGHFQLPYGVLRRIIAGSQAPKSTLDFVQTLIRQSKDHIELVQARIAPDRYAILVPA